MFKTIKFNPKNNKGVYMTFLEISEFRYACKKFDINKKISDDDFAVILEAGRLAPSSFGLEPTRLIASKNDNFKNELKKACWDQNHIAEASHVVIFKSLKANMQASSNYIKEKSLRRTDGDSKMLEAFTKKYGSYLENMGYKNHDSIYNYTSLQAYIVATAMMYCAASLKIDTCMIGGFEKSKIESLLKIDNFKEQVSLVMCFGFKDQVKSKRKRISMNEFVEYK